MTMQGDCGIATAGCLLMITTNRKGGLPHEDEAKKEPASLLPMQALDLTDSLYFGAGASRESARRSPLRRSCPVRRSPEVASVDIDRGSVSIRAENPDSWFSSLPHGAPSGFMPFSSLPCESLRIISRCPPRRGITCSCSFVDLCRMRILQITIACLKCFFNQFPQSNPDEWKLKPLHHRGHRGEM